LFATLVHNAQSSDSTILHYRSETVGIERNFDTSGQAELLSCKLQRLSIYWRNRIGISIGIGEMTLVAVECTAKRNTFVNDLLRKPRTYLLPFHVVEGEKASKESSGGVATKKGVLINKKRRSSV